MAPEMEERFQTLQEIVKAARQNLAPGPVGLSDRRRRRPRRRSGATGRRSTRWPSARASCATCRASTAPRPSSGAPHPHAGDARADRLDRELRPGRRRLVGEGVGGVRHPADAELGVQSRPRSGGQGRRQLPHLPALRARRRRVGRRPRQARARSRLRGVLSHGGHRRVQPARARPRQALREAVAHARRRLQLPGRALLGSRQALQGHPPGHAAGAQGHRDSAKTRRWPSSTASRSSTSAITAAGSSITGAAAWTSCPRSSTR